MPFIGPPKTRAAAHSAFQMNGPPAASSAARSGAQVQENINGGKPFTPYRLKPINNPSARMDSLNQHSFDDGAGMDRSSAGARAEGDPWSDKSLSPDQRADLLIQQMTLEEKLSLVHGDDG
jgi:hypothetical protein